MTPRWRPHPFAVAFLPVPAIVAVLVAPGVTFGLICAAASVVAILAKSWRLALVAAATAVLGTAILWFGFAMSLPAEPFGTPSATVDWLPLRPTVDQALAALRGALRVVVVMLLFVAGSAHVRGTVFTDSLIRYVRVPYRVADVIALGAQFAVGIRRDVAAARAIARLRARGRGMGAARIGARLTVPVLMASFRRADELSVAMEARGFAALPDRTLHYAVAPRALDAVLLALGWCVTVVVAMAVHG
ncbi:energy-coupling factor transporter transmembrane component T [Gulosibacter faecalis]|uniref:Energy-coupling factor transporter transmembrane component T n=1 Tax=Gulosibacter faecalis TaxID=272240 RepID=A0ABW5UZF9_9MICO|nr:energy-coupling factor transporter transmembrane component T [Gulosibacter faecalis]